MTARADEVESKYHC